MLWRNTLSNILHKLILFLAIFIFLWGCFLGLLRLSLPLLSQHRDVIIHSIATAVGVPLEVGNLETHWHGIRPMIALSNVKVLDDQQHSRLLIPEVNVEVNILQSLLHRHIEIKLLQINGWQVKVYQNKQHQWLVDGLKTNHDEQDDSEVTLNNLLIVLAHIHHLQIAQAQAEITPYQKTKIVADRINFDWYNKSGHLSFYGQLGLSQPTIRQLNFAAQLEQVGSELDLNNLQGHFYIKSSHFNPQVLLQLFPSFDEHWHWQQGTVAGQLWGSWLKNDWQQLRIALSLNQIKLMQKAALPWGIAISQGQLDGDFDSHTMNQARFVLASRNATFFSGKLFRKPLAINALQVQGQWYQQQEMDHLQINHINLQLPDGKVLAKLHLNWLPQQAPEMSLMAHAELVNLSNPSLYLPVAVMPHKVVSWLDQSVSHLTKVTANMVWRGPVNKFPFHDQSGTMQIDGQVYGATVDFTPGWPIITGLNADLHFTSHGMHIVAKQGKLGKIAIQNVTADIPEFSAQSHLLIDGKIHDDLSNAWDFLRKAPFAKKWQPALQASSATGPIKVDLALDIPLYENGRSPQYQGTAVFAQQDQINLVDPFVLTDLQGELNFSNDVWSSKSLQANLFGQPWSISVQRSKANNPVSVAANGALDLNALSTKTKVPNLLQMTGVTPVSLNLNIPTEGAKPLQWRLQSSLVGASLQLPLGFAKKAQQTAPLLLVDNSASKNQADFALRWRSPQGLVQIKKQGAQYIIRSAVLAGKAIAPASQDDSWNVVLSLLDLRRFTTDSTSHTAVTQLPALNLSAAKVLLKNNIFGLKLQLVPQGQNVTRFMLGLQQKLYKLNAAGVMDTNGTSIEGSLKTQNLAKTLQAFDVPSIMDAQQAHFKFDLNWPGQLWDLDRNQLQGHVQIKMDSGVFSDISESTNNALNLGRLLNLLSISNLPNLKRFSQKGFQFNTLTGELLLASNRIEHLDVTINGDVADAHLQGCINIAQQQLNLSAQINPHLTSSVPVIAAIAGGPIAGAIGFVADKLLSPAVGTITSMSYLVQGDWQNPKTTKVTAAAAQQAVATCVL